MAQKIFYDSKHILSLVSSVAEWNSDSLSLSLVYKANNRLKSWQSLRIMPIYVYDSDTVRFPAMGCYTPSGARYRNRRNSFVHAETDKEKIFVLGKGSDSIFYSEKISIPFSGSGEVVLQYVLSDCCSSCLLCPDSIFVPKRAAAGNDLSGHMAAVSVPLFESNVTFIEPPKESVKKRIDTMSVYIGYPLNNWKIYPEFEENAEELQMLERFISPILADTGTYKIDSVSIEGYASIEGTWSYNMQLSQKRAESMREYICSQYGISVDMIKAEGKGENWEGLRKVIMRGNSIYKDKIIHIIDTYDISEGRESRLMELDNGKVYNNMLRNIFPSLRCIKAEVRYDIRHFGTDEAGKIIHSRPQDLSHYEMYKVARAENTEYAIIRNRDNYGCEYDIAVRYFPNDDIACINASSAALVRGNLDEAWTYLERVKDNPLAYNNIGVYYWLCNRISDAEKFFEKAKKTDSIRAEYNLEQLGNWKKQFECIEKQY